MASGRLRLDHPKRMLDLGADKRFSGFDKIIKSPLRRIGQNSAHSRSHGNAEPDHPALHLLAYFNSLISGIRVDHRLLPVQEIGCWGEIMQIGGRGFHRMDEAILTIDADVDLPLRGHTATFRSTIGCPPWSDASLDLAPHPYSRWS